MLTKKILVEYAKQNPSKYAHKFGHIDLSKYANDDDVILEPRATTNLDGTPAMPKQLDNQPNMAGIGTNHPTYGADVKPAPALSETASALVGGGTGSGAGIASAVVQPSVKDVLEGGTATATLDAGQTNAPVLDETVKDETTVSGGDANGGTTLNEN